MLFAGTRLLAISALSTSKRRQRQLNCVSIKPAAGHATVRSLSPDVVILASIERYVEWVAFIVRGMGLRCLYFHDALSTTPESGLPWIGSSLIPTGKIWSRFAVALQWHRIRLDSVVRFHFMSALRLRLDFNKIQKKFAGRYGYALSAKDCRSFRRQVPTLIELVACPEPFEFTGLGMANRHYIEASLCLSRAAPTFPWYRLDEKRSLVYCALGSLLWGGKASYLKFFRVVVEVARSRPDLQFVIATGNALDPDDLDAPPPNLVIVKHAPQMHLLRRADMMITHGGTNSVKECIHFGVPMIAFPLGFDQPGNVARLTYHGLGVRGDLRKASPRYLLRLIETIERGPDFRRHMQCMQAKFRAADEAALGVQVVESILWGSQANAHAIPKKCVVLE